jgi:hypothetical protein
MKRVSFSQSLVFLLIFTLGISVCDAQPLGTGPVGRTKRGLFGLTFGKKQNDNIKKPRSVNKIKKEQAKKEKKKKQDYARSVKESQKRAIKIQTPEVQARMKQDKKNISSREKAKKKKIAESTRKARQKYK